MSRWWLCSSLALVACDPAPMHDHPEPRTPVSAPCSRPDFRLIDLTHRMYPEMPVWPGGVPFKMTRLTDYPDGYRSHKFEMGENTGTHVDAPAHFVEGKRAIDQIPIDELVVPMVVINLRDKTEKNADYQLSGNDIVDWEANNGQVPVGSVVVINTGWHKKFEDPDAYINQDGSGVMHFPGVARDAAELLVDRDVAGVGIDTLSIDAGSSTDFSAHKILLGANKYQIENLANLDELPETGATIIVAVLPVSDGSQAQARVLAMVPEVPEGGEEGEEGEEEEPAP
jgi:kynurenine formamidase